MRSLSFLVLATLACVSVASFAPQPCSALQLQRPALTATLDRAFRSLAVGDAASGSSDSTSSTTGSSSSSSSNTIFIPTYGTVTLPFGLSASSIPGYDAATQAIGNSNVAAALAFLQQAGIIDGASSSTGAGAALGDGGLGGGIVDGSTNGTSITSTGGAGVGVSGNGNGNGNGAKNAAGAMATISWIACGTTALAAVAAGAAML